MMLSICRPQENSLYEQYTVHLTNHLGLLGATQRFLGPLPVLEQSPVGSAKLEEKKEKKRVREGKREGKKVCLRKLTGPWLCQTSAAVKSVIWEGVLDCQGALASGWVSVTTCARRLSLC